MITGTYVLTDQIDNGFADIIGTSLKGTAVQVEPKRSFTSLEGGATQTLNDDLVARVLAVPGVDKAAGGYETVGAAIVDGKAVETGGAPTLLTTARASPSTRRPWSPAVRSRGATKSRSSRASPTRPASSPATRSPSPPRPASRRSRSPACSSGATPCHSAAPSSSPAACRTRSAGAASPAGSASSPSPPIQA